MKSIEQALRGGAHDAARAAETAAERFGSRADEARLLDVAYGYVDTPFGRYLAATTPRGLVMLSFDADYDEVLEELSRRVSPRVLEAPGKLDELRRELDEYFEGDRHDFDIPLDWQLSSGFMQKVLRATAKIPYGGVATYREVATRAGNPRAMRAAGNALGANPIPIVVPCHRVVRTGGSVGNYGGGPDMKRALLQLEGAIL
ncbi:MAG: methylated-DNA--[protein]-cysteine S-methyltransferase [Actinomycetota bacterium]